MIQSIFFFNQARIKAMQEESTEVAMDILEHGASSPMSEETPFFLKAKPLWGKDLRDEMNVVCYFVCSFSKKEASSLILTGNNFFRVFLNGFFL
jgi:hypothetical protein